MSDDKNARVHRTMTDKDEIQLFGGALKKFREQVLHLSAAQVADKMDIPWGTYVRLERGECWPLQYAQKLHALGFHQTAMLRELHLSADEHTELTRRLTDAQYRNSKLLREGKADKEALRRAMRATRVYGDA